MKTQKILWKRLSTRTFCILMATFFMMMAYALNAQTLVVDPVASTVSITGNGTAFNFDIPTPGVTGTIVGPTAFAPASGFDFHAYQRLLMSDGWFPSSSFARFIIESRVRAKGDNTGILNIDWMNSVKLRSDVETGFWADASDSLGLSLKINVTPGGNYPTGSVVPVFYKYSLFGIGSTKHENEPVKEDPILCSNTFSIDGTDEVGNTFNFNNPALPPSTIPNLLNRKVSVGIIMVTVGTPFTIQVSSTISSTIAVAGDTLITIQDMAQGYFTGNLQLGVTPTGIIPNFVNVATPATTNSHSEFSLDIGSDCERSDPNADGDEVFDPGDAYILGGTALSPLGQNGVKDDLAVFGWDPKPIPTDVTTAAPCGTGPLYVDSHFDLDAMDNISVSLQNFAYGPGNASIPPFNDNLIHLAENFMISFDDDEGANYTSNVWGYGSVPVNSFSPYRMDTFGLSYTKNEIIAVDFDAYNVPSAGFTLDSLYDEEQVHISLTPNPDSLSIDDDDVDALDFIANDSIQSIYYFSPDHEATSFNPFTSDTLRGGCIYTATNTAIFEIVNCATHLGLDPNTDIDAFEFGWVWDSVANRLGLALLFSVDDDDWQTPIRDESGGLNPNTIYYSFMNGTSHEFSAYNLADDIDAITLCPHSMNGWASIACPNPILIASTVTDASSTGTNDGAIVTTVAGGTPPYTYIWSNGETTPDIANLTVGTYTVTVAGSNNCTASLDVVVDIATVTAPPWAYTITAANHTILIGNAIPVTICGTPIAVGDYIGVFYDSLGTQACGGYFIWQGTNSAVAAWAEDIGNDGFVSGEQFQWKIWDASTHTEYQANASYLPSSVAIPNEGYFAGGGISGLASLQGNETQTIQLPQGWFIMSSYIDPLYPNMNNIFAGCVQNVLLVKDENGSVYWPAFSLNAIGNLSLCEGYKIKMAAPTNLVIKGCSVDPPNFPCTFASGWSIIPYLRKVPGAITTMLSPIVNDVIIVKDWQGNAYLPNWFNFNGIGNMVPGQGYQIKLLNPVTFTYPANPVNTSKYSVTGHVGTNPNPLNTGSNMTLAIPLGAWENTPNQGDLVSIYTPRGALCGQGKFIGDNLAIPVWGNDEFSSGTNGMMRDEKINIRIRDTQNSTEQQIIVDSWQEGDEHYETNKIAIVNSLKFEETEVYRLDQNKPNPFDSETGISYYLPKDCQVELEVFNIIGEKIATGKGLPILSQNMAKGKHSIIFDRKDLPPGTYFYRLRTKEFEGVKKMVILKQ